MAELTAWSTVDSLNFVNQQLGKTKSTGRSERKTFELGVGDGELLLQLMLAVCHKLNLGIGQMRRYQGFELSARWAGLWRN